MERKNTETRFEQLRAKERGKCSHCGALANFTIQYTHPTMPGRPGMAGVNALMLQAQFQEIVAGQFVRIFRCMGCQGETTEVLPRGDTPTLEQVWPRVSRTFVANEFEDKIPKQIVSDFREASLIEILSPKASAALSRRCLQAVILNKFETLVSGRTKLKSQVKAVLDAETLPSFIADELHGIRSIGNNAAHPTVDPENGEIIDVVPGEASACLDVLEDLIDHLYVKPIKSAARKLSREQKYGKDDR